MDYETIKARKLNPVIGAEVTGIDLSQPLTELQVREIRNAWLEHPVIQIQAPGWSGESQLAFARHFGPLHVHPAIDPMSEQPELLTFVTDETTRQVAGENWHSDVTCDDEPPMGSILYIIEVPGDGGGDTLFANMYAAYEALSPPLQEMLLGLTAVHDSVQAFRRKDGPQKRAEHPVVRTHPETGKRALFVNPLYTSHIVGLNRNESAAILELLFRHMETPEFCARLHWQPGTVTLWDNRCVQHRAVWDYYPGRRVGRRVAIAGDRPFLDLAAATGGSGPEPGSGSPGARLFNLRPRE